MSVRRCDLPPALPPRQSTDSPIRRWLQSLCWRKVNYTFLGRRYVSAKGVAVQRPAPFGIGQRWKRGRNCGRYGSLFISASPIRASRCGRGQGSPAITSKSGRRFSGPCGRNRQPSKFETSARSVVGIAAIPRCKPSSLLPTLRGKPLRWGLESHGMQRIFLLVPAHPSRSSQRPSLTKATTSTGTMIVESTSLEMIWPSMIWPTGSPVP